MMMSPSSILTTPTSKPSQPAILPFIQSKSNTSSSFSSSSSSSSVAFRSINRRELIATGIIIACPTVLVIPARAEADEEYVRETTEMIKKVRSTINMDKADPEVPTAVAELRDASNSWVAKYRKEKDLLGRPSFRDIYSALNAVSGHYISFGPTAPIPTKRKARILEEVETAEKALLRGR